MFDKAAETGEGFLDHAFAILPMGNVGLEGKHMVVIGELFGF